MVTDKDDAVLTAVREGHAFDKSALEKYLSRELSGFQGNVSLLQFEGGQSNPTFVIESGSDRYVLRKQPPGELLRSAHQVDREYRVMKALENTPVPVPHMYTACDDTNIIGTKFYVMELVEGRLCKDTLMPGFEPEERTAVYKDLARVLALLHQVDVEAVGLSEFGRPGNYFARQVGRWSKQYVASKTEEIEAMDNLMEWLPDNLPSDVPPVVVHGDYRLGNILLDNNEGKIVAVLDWELSTLGDGLADLGYICQDYHAASYTDEGLYTADLDSLGILSEEAFVAEYCKHANREQIDNWLFYVAYNMFRSAGIIQGVYKRGLDGNASSETALEYKEIARMRSERAWELVNMI